MSEVTPFQATPEPIVTQPTPNAISIPPELTEFVGEGKKYATVELALASVAHAQTYIPTLQQQLKDAQEELQKRKTAEELLETFKLSGLPNKELPSTPGLTADAVAQLVEQSLAQRDSATKQKQNTDAVVSALGAVHGDKAEDFYKTIAADNGLTIPELNRLAATSPNVVLKLAGVDKKATVFNKPSSTVNAEALLNQQQPSALSAKVPLSGSTTKSVTQAWRNAGETVRLRNS